MIRFVVVAEYLQDFGLLEVKAKSPHSDLELVVIDTPILVGVEQFERLLDFLLLLVRELRSRMCASFGLLCGRIHWIAWRGWGVARVEEERGE